MEMTRRAPSVSQSEDAARPHISVVIPVYRSEEIVTELVGQLSSALQALGHHYEIVLVEDGGGDRSWDYIQQLAAADTHARGIRFSRNFGQHLALTAGMDYARGDWIVWMDCDLQDSPQEIRRLYQKAREGYDVVLARRVERKDGRLQARLSALFYRVFQYFTGIKADPSVGTFRILSRKVARYFVSMREQERFVGGMIEWMGFRSATVDVPRPARHSGKSTYNFRRRLDLALTAIVSFSNKPLILSIKLGFVFAALSVGYATYLVYRKLFFGIPVEGWTSVIVSLYLLGGIMMIMMGVLGLYIGRIFDQTKARPLYIVDETTFDV